MAKEPDSTQTRTDRGQAYSLEGVIGAILIVSALVLGLQAVSVAPWADSGFEQGTDIREQMEDTLDILEDQDALRTGVLCLGGENERTPHVGVVSADPAVDPFGTVLNQTASTTTDYNIYVDYPSNGNVNRTLLGTRSQPTGSTVTVTREIALFDSDTMFEFNPNTPACVVDSQYDDLGDVPDSDIYLENQNEDTELYAVVQIRVVAW
ncbi:hypothetical protein ACFQJ7_15370 [Halovenus rubra]|uniref:Uncharacterized protein n=2 Tax=Halovenus rubra TaxID=869890 RepID=A0ACC7E2J4_9EURY|nr:hypothetical protein [Halovenus rubra]